jgi:hypothetical protein
MKSDISLEEPMTSSSTNTTNSIVRDEFDILHKTQAMRQQIVDTLTDADLAYRLPGANPSFGALCREIGEIEQTYINSFKTFKHNYSYKVNDPELERNLQHLKAWYNKLDEELDTALSALSEDDVLKKPIDRSGGFMALPKIQMHIYREALLIFYGKATVYLRALNKPLSQQIQDWVG